ncbi:MAG: SDR family oxidoreductase [Desulfamplus sp.]|nr:SDR family oxidoreductase [Desulfamplus sp.]
MAGLVMVAPNITSDHKQNPDTSNLINTTNSKFDINNTKSFLKKAFLLAKQSGRYLTNTSSFFATISFIGGSFGFGDENISDPIQGGLAGLTKTAALEWSGVLCRAFDFSSNIETTNVNVDLSFKSYKEPSDFDLKSEIQAAVSLMLTRYSTNSVLHNAVEIGIKDRFCLIPEMTNQPLLSLSSVPEKFDSDISSVKSSMLSEHGNYKYSKTKDIVIITGGARGVTAECAIELASRFSPVIILIGRSPLPEPEPAWLNGVVSEADIKKAVLANFAQYKSVDIDTLPLSSPTPMELQKICRTIIANREISQTLERISDAGSVVEYYSVDIRNFEDVNKAIEDVRKKFGKITAIVHGAGTLEDKLIIDKTEAQFSSVFDTKVVGMENLLNVTIHDELKYVVFFSSVAARYGNAGQVDYAMANEVLNKTAQYYSKQQNNKNGNHDKCQFISINWGPWEGGMVSPSLKNAFLKRGIDLIPLKEGAESFVDEICISLSKTDQKTTTDQKNTPPDVEVVIGASLFGDVKSYQNPEKSNSTTEISSDYKKHDIKNDTQNRQSQPILFSREQILEFAIGSPSKAFGERYREFDTEREIARLPGPPYFFMDRVIKADAKQWEMAPGGWIEAQFDMPCDGWYFRAGHTDYLPFSILLEIALQPCGWLAAYSGSALKSKERLFFRNLGGEAQIFEPVKRIKRSSVSITEQKITTDKEQTGLISMDRDFITLTMRAKMTSVSQAGGMIIQNFLMEVLLGNNYIYKGKTNFGFFTAHAFANQAGIQNAALMSYNLPQNDDILSELEDYKVDIEGCYGMPEKALRMVDSIELLLPDGGTYGKGFIKGIKKVNPEEWFFKAHFYQDPVCPGSLGVESFLQIVKFYALNVWQYDPDKYDLVMASHTHKWIYRGQIIPSCKKIEICAHVKDITNNSTKITADGLLYVDGLCIYQMEDFSMELVKR